MTESNNIPKLRFPEFEGEWRIQKLGKICEKISDGIHSTPVYDDNGNFYFINGNNLVDGKIVITNNTKKVNKTEALIHSRELSEKSILLSINGTIGNLAYYNNEKVVLGKSACYLNFREIITKKFVFNFLQNHTIQNYFNSELTGSTIKNLSLASVKNAKLSLPSLTEQQKIASFFTAIDDKIQQLTKKKSLLEQYKKGVMQKIFNQEIRFKDDDGKEFPEWEIKKLDDISKNVMYGLNRASTEFNGEDKYLRITDIDERTNKFEVSNLTSPSGLLDDSYVVKEGDILFARTGASVGKSYIYDTSDGKLYFAGFLIRFSIKNADPRFIFYQTLLKKYWRWVKIMSMRSGQPGINATEYKTLKVYYPCLEEQHKIASILSAIDNKIEQVNTQLEKTKTFKKGLLQQMFV